MKLIVKTADVNPGQWVEAAFDEFSVTEGSVANFDLENVVFSVAPNPSINYFSVRYNVGMLHQPTLNISAIDGRIMQNIRLEKSSNELNFGENLPAGIYFISLQDQQNIIKTVKVVKK